MNASIRYRYTCQSLPYTHSVQDHLEHGKKGVTTQGIMQGEGLSHIFVVLSPVNKITEQSVNCSLNTLSFSLQNIKLER